MPLFNPQLVAPLADPPAPDPADATAIQDFTAGELAPLDLLLSRLNNFAAGASSALDVGDATLQNVGGLLDAGDTLLQTLSNDIDAVDFTAEIATAAAAEAAGSDAEGISTALAGLITGDSP